MNDPTQPKSINRSLSFSKIQQVGVTILMLIVLAALFNVFGKTRLQQTQKSDAITVTVQNPTKLRYKTIDSIVIEVKNTSPTALDAIQVTIPTTYLAAFSNVKASPEPTVITDQVYTFTLPTIQAGDTAVISLELQAEDYWSHSGTVKVRQSTEQEVAINISTFVLP